MLKPLFGKSPRQSELFPQHFPNRAPTCRVLGGNHGGFRDGVVGKQPGELPQRNRAAYLHADYVVPLQPGGFAVHGDFTGKFQLTLQDE